MPITLTFASIDDTRVQSLVSPLLGSLSCGFPSPAGDYLEKDLDLHAFLVPRPSSTFFGWSSGLSLIHRGIPNKALLVIDASLTPRHDDVVAAHINGEWTCKVLDAHRQCLTGTGETPIVLSDEGITIFGVVTKAINVLCSR